MHIATVKQQQGLQNKKVYTKSGTYGMKFCRQLFWLMQMKTDLSHYSTPTTECYRGCCIVSFPDYFLSKDAVWEWGWVLQGVLLSQHNGCWFMATPSSARLSPPSHSPPLPFPPGGGWSQKRDTVASRVPKTWPHLWNFLLFDMHKNESSYIT